MTYPPWHVGPARQSPEPAAARGRAPRRRAAAHPGGGRLGKDARSHPSHRTPPARAPGAGPGDPRRHVHEQGRRRAARASGEAGRPGRGAALGGDVPRRRSAHPPPRSGGARAHAQLRHLRRRGSARGGEAGDQRSGLRRGHRPAAAGAHRSLEERGPASRRSAGRGVRRARQDGAQGVRAVPGRAAGLQRGRLRRPDRARHRAVQEARRHPPGLRRPLPAHPGRRVPGHQPRPVPSPAPARVGPRKSGRGRRRRSVHLPLARRRGGQHPRLPQALPRNPGGAAGTELPQLGADPGRRARHHRKERAPRQKKLWTAAGEGEKVRVFLAEDERDEGARIASELYAENARGTAYSEMAVFYRANAQSRALEDALRARRVPYRVVRGRSFYDRAEVKDIAAYLRLCVNPRSDGDLLRVINTPPRGIGDTTVEHLRASANRQGLSIWEALSSSDPEMPANARAKVAPFKALIDELRRGVAEDAGAADAIERVIDRTGYADRLRLEGEEGEDRLENLLELVGAAREFDRAWAGELRQPPDSEPAPAARPEPKPLVPNPLTQTRAQYLRAVRAAPGSLGSSQASEDPPGDRPDPAAALAAASPDDEDGRADTPLLGFLEQLALVGDADAAAGGDRVSLMTLHAAKGLEFDAVWMTGMEERVFPSSRSLGQP